MNLTSQPQIAAKDAYAIFAPGTGESAPHRVGAPAFDAAGRKFRFAQVGATTLVAGTLLQSPAIVAAHVDCSINTALAVLGATSLLVVLGATAVNANYYAGGTVMVSNGAGIGYSYTIASHPAALSSGNVIVQLVGSESLQVAANSVTRVDLISHPYKNVIVSPTTATGDVIGVAMAPVPNAQFGWVQTGGRCPVLIDASAPAIGVPVGASTATAGAVMGATNNATTQLVASIGRMAQTGVSAKEKLVFLTIE